MPKTRTAPAATHQRHQGRRRLPAIGPQEAGQAAQLTQVAAARAPGARVGYRMARTFHRRLLSTACLPHRSRHRSRGRGTWAAFNPNRRTAQSRRRRAGPGAGALVADGDAGRMDEDRRERPASDRPVAWCTASRAFASRAPVPDLAWRGRRWRGGKLTPAALVDPPSGIGSGTVASRRSASPSRS